MALLNRSEFFTHAQVKGVYLSTHEAMESLADPCP
jgi:hypothetical protein